MKVLIIDPWGTGNTAEYLNGLVYAVNNYVDLFLYTNDGFELENHSKCTVIRGFFKKSDYLPSGKKRTIIRGLEYIKSYVEIISFIKKNKFDIVHINWFLNYRLDALFLKYIKKYCNTVVYTAHNVIPHVSGERYIDNLNKIYSMVDKIIVHGESIKKEFKDFFPLYIDKVFIQYHGANIKSKTSYEMNRIDSSIREYVNGYKRIYICFGKQFYNKGSDRLIRIWNENDIPSLLIIAGRVSDDYSELKVLIQKNKKSNVLVLDYFVEENMLNFLIQKASVIIIPYRHASMSGVVFTAADFKKTVIATKVGAIPEYLEDGVDSFLCENREDALSKKILDIENEITDEVLEDMGEKLRKNIYAKFSWKTLGDAIFNDIYGSVK